MFRRQTILIYFAALLTTSFAYAQTTSTPVNGATKWPTAFSVYDYGPNTGTPYPNGYNPNGHSAGSTAGDSQLLPTSGSTTTRSIDHGYEVYAAPTSAQSAQVQAQQAAAGGGSGAGSNGNTYNNTYGNSNGNNNANQQSAQQQINQNQCNQAENLAYKCCTNPEACMTLSGAGSQGASGIGQAVQTILTLGANLPSNSISSMCGRGKTIADISSALDMYLANQCRMAVSACQSSCGNQTCTQYSGTEVSLTTQALAGQLAAKFDQMCQQQTQSTAQNSFNNPDCSTAAEAATPFCQYKCNRPGAAADPTCSGIIAQMQNGTMNGLNVNNSGSSTNPFAGIVPTTQDQQQIPPIPNTPPSASQLSQTQPGGSAGQFNGFEGYGSNSVSSASTTPSKSKGWNTHIMKGLASGNGYTAPTGAAPGGGGGTLPAYNAKGQHLNLFGQPFNLANYLPGGKDANKTLTVRRSPADVTADLNPPSDDIFEDVSKGYYEACLKHMLYNCGPTIRAYEYRYHHQFTSTHGGFH